MNEIMQRRFGTSELLQLANHDWLEAGMHAKTVKFNVGSGGLPAEVNWEDKSAAVALIKNPKAKALASLLLWGSDDNWDWTQCFNELVEYLAKKMIGRCNHDDRGDPKGRYTLEKLARLMARMTLHFELYNLWSLYTEEGRLLFSGIDISPNTYQQIWRTYEKRMLDDLKELKWDVEDSIKAYMNDLKYVDDESINSNSIFNMTHTKQMPEIGDIWTTSSHNFEYAVLAVNNHTVIVRNINSKKKIEFDLDLFVIKTEKLEI